MRWVRRARKSGRRRLRQIGTLPRQIVRIHQALGVYEGHRWLAPLRPAASWITTPHPEPGCDIGLVSHRTPAHQPASVTDM
jgi:hypothetical protein